MSAFDAFLQALFIKPFLIPSLILGAVLLVLAQFLPTLRKLIFAKYMDLFSPTYDSMVSDTKTAFFSDLPSIVSADPFLKNSGQLRILELGVGTGANFKYYPKNTRLIAVDPNEEFLGYFHRNHAEFPHITLEKFIVTSGESLNSSQIPDNSVDVVVTTLVLCSLNEYAGFLSEISRVLAPGGRYYFWDHIEAPAGTRNYYLQNVISRLFFWSYFGCGCKVNKRPHEAIASHPGFRRVTYEKFDVEQIPDDWLHKYIFATFLKYHLRGVAVK